MNRTEAEDADEEEPRLIDWIREIYVAIGLFIDLVIGLPMYILERSGINLIPDLFAANCPLCSVCLCGAILGMTASLGIGLGVGLGVGLNCGQTQAASNNNPSAPFVSTNSTAMNITG